jgi:hypothetical protein
MLLHFPDIGVIFIGNTSSPFSAFFPDFLILNSSQTPLSFPASFYKKRWIFVCNSDTGIAPFYLLNVLSSFRSKHLIVGRFGCVPTPDIPFNVPFKLCHKFPLLRSGFAFSADLLGFFRSSGGEFEYSIGLSFENATVVDHFEFTFLPPASRPRWDGFLASFWPLESSDLPLRFAHAAGISVQVSLTPYALHTVVVGGETAIVGKDVKWSEIISLKCAGPGPDIVRPVRLYVGRPVLEVRCFD